MQRTPNNAAAETANAALAALLTLAAIFTAPHALWTVASWTGI